MNKTKLLTTAFAAATLALSTTASAGDMEKCRVLDANGEGLIKAGKAKCGTPNHSCDGQNKDGEKEAWILVPAGECAKINMGDLSGVDSSTKDAIYTDRLPKMMDSKTDMMEEAKDKAIDMLKK